MRIGSPPSIVIACSELFLFLFFNFAGGRIATKLKVTTLLWCPLPPNVSTASQPGGFACSKPRYPTGPNYRVLSLPTLYDVRCHPPAILLVLIRSVTRYTAISPTHTHPRPQAPRFPPVPRTSCRRTPSTLAGSGSAVTGATAAACARAESG